MLEKKENDRSRPLLSIWCLPMNYRRPRQPQTHSSQLRSRQSRGGEAPLPSGREASHSIAWALLREHRQDARPFPPSQCRPDAVVQMGQVCLEAEMDPLNMPCQGASEGTYMSAFPSSDPCFAPGLNFFKSPYIFFPRAAVTKDHKLGGFQQKFVLSQF